ncbi:MAG: ester cyclase [Dehalococcoidia bacterium]
MTDNSPAEVLQRFFDGYNAQDSAAVSRAVSPDIEFARPGQSLVGRDSLIAAYQWDWADFPDCRLEVTAMFSGSAAAAAEASWIATNTGSLHLPDGTVAPPTGRAVTLPCAAVGHVEDGVLTSLRLYWDNADLFQQLGLA